MRPIVNWSVVARGVLYALLTVLIVGLVVGSIMAAPRVFGLLLILNVVAAFGWALATME